MLKTVQKIANSTATVVAWRIRSATRLIMTAHPFGWCLSGLTFNPTAPIILANQYRSQRGLLWLYSVNCTTMLPLYLW